MSEEQAKYNPISPEQREEIQEIREAHLLARRRNKYIGDYHHSETIDEWVGLLLSSEHAWREEADREGMLRRMTLKLAEEQKMKHEIKLNQAIEVLKWYADDSNWKARTRCGNCGHDLDEDLEQDSAEWLQGGNAKGFLSSLSQGTEDK